MGERKLEAQRSVTLFVAATGSGVDMWGSFEPRHASRAWQTEPRVERGSWWVIVCSDITRIWLLMSTFWISVTSTLPSESLVQSSWISPWTLFGTQKMVRTTRHGQRSSWRCPRSHPDLVLTTTETQSSQALRSGQVITHIWESIALRTIRVPPTTQKLYADALKAQQHLLRHVFFYSEEKVIVRTKSLAVLNGRATKNLKIHLADTPW